MQWLLKFIFGRKLYMFRTVPACIIRSSSLYTQQWYTSYSLRADQDVKTLHVSDSSSAHHQEFFTVHTAMVYVIQFASRIRTLKLYMFRTVPLSIIRSFSLYIQQWDMSYSWREDQDVKTPHVSCNSSVHHQEFFTVHTAMVYAIQLASRISTELHFRPDPANL